jgi:pimeloyl-ACP methyl ester carboxylesterase
MTRTHVLTMVTLLASSCAPEHQTAEPVTAVFDLDSEDLFDVPFPSEIRRTDEGKVDVSLFPNPRSIIMVDTIKTAISDQMEGFGTNSGIYLRFSGPIDTATLPPTPGISTSPVSSLQLLNVDPTSPRLGERIPVTWFFREAISDFWSPNTLAVLPVAGWVLDPDTLYAVAVTDDVTGTDESPVLRDEDFGIMIDDVTDFGPFYSGAESAYRQAMQAFRNEGVEPDRIVTAAVFRTVDPVSEMIALRDDVLDNTDPPEVLDIEIHEELSFYTVYTGHYSPNPNYQHGFSAGLSPYETEGGYIEFDSSGNPVRDGDETMRFSVAVPTGTPPASGWPTVLYAHGTGGDYLSYTRNDVAALLTYEGVAVIGIDNAMNGARIPEDAEADLLFFNIGNILAARDNIRQAAVDVIQLERLVPDLVIDAETSVDGEEHTFSDANLAFMGHSQGGLNGALYLAVSDNVEGAVLSGAGGSLIYSFIYKTGPYRLRNLMGIVFGFTGSNAELDAEDFDIYHPILNLAQMFFEPADGVNYGRHWHLEPLPGVRAKSVLMTEGMDDSYAPPETIEPLAASAYLAPINPVISTVDGLALKGLTPLDSPVSGNCAMNTRTCGLIQYPVNAGWDGHFVAFHDENAMRDWSTFLVALVSGGLPIIDTM